MIKTGPSFLGYFLYGAKINVITLRLITEKIACAMLGRYSQGYIARYSQKAPKITVNMLSLSFKANTSGSSCISPRWACIQV
jgi:hypothetical protein